MFPKGICSWRRKWGLIGLCFVLVPVTQAAPGDLQLEVLTRTGDPNVGPDFKPINFFETAPLGDNIPVAIDDSGFVTFAADVETDNGSQFGFYQMKADSTPHVIFQSDWLVPGLTRNGDVVESQDSPRRGFTMHPLGGFHAFPVIADLGDALLYTAFNGEVENAPLTWPIDLSETRNFKFAVEVSDGRGETRFLSPGTSTEMLVSTEGDLFWALPNAIFVKTAFDDIKAVVFADTPAPGFLPEENATFGTSFEMRGTDLFGQLVFLARVNTTQGARDVVYRYGATENGLDVFFVEGESTLPGLDPNLNPQIQPEDVLLGYGAFTYLRASLSSTRAGFWRISDLGEVEEMAIFTANGFFPTQTDQGDVEFRGLNNADWAVDGDGNLFFSADLRNGNSSSVAEGVWRIDGETKAITTLARAPLDGQFGDAPGTEATYKTFSQLTAVGPNLAFMAELSDGTNGLFATDANGGVIKIALEGDELDDSVITSIHFTADLAGQDVRFNKGNSGLNGFGELAFLATLENGTTALVKATYEGLVRPVGNTYIWDGGAGDTNWHTVVDGRSNWTDAFGTPWDRPPTTNGTAEIEIGDDYLVEVIDDWAHVNKVTLGNSSLEISKDFECVTTFEGADLSSIVLKSGVSKGGTLTTTGPILKEGPDNAWLIWDLITIEEIDITVEGGHLNFWSDLKLIDSSLVVVGGTMEKSGLLQFEGQSGLFEVKASPQPVRLFSEPKIVLGTDVQFKLSDETTIQVGDQTSNKIVVEPLEGGNTRKLELVGAGQVIINYDLEVKEGVQLINRIGHLPDARLMFDTNLVGEVERFTPVQGLLENRGRLEIRSGGITGNFKNYNDLIISNHIGGKPAVRLDCVNHGTIFQDGTFTSENFTAKVGSQHIFKQVAGPVGSISFDAIEPSTIVFEKGSSIHVEDGLSSILFETKNTPNLEAQIIVYEWARFRCINAHTGPDNSITIEKDGLMEFTDLSFEKLEIRGKGRSVLKGDLIPLSDTAEMTIGTQDFDAEEATFIGSSLGSDTLVVYQLEPLDSDVQQASFSASNILENATVFNSPKTNVSLNDECKVDGRFIVRGKGWITGSLLSNKSTKPFTKFELTIGWDDEPGELRVSSIGDDPAIISAELSFLANSKVIVTESSHAIFEYTQRFNDRYLQRNNWVIEDFAACELRDPQFTDGLPGIDRGATVKIGKPHPTLPSFVNLPTIPDGFRIRGELTVQNAELSVGGDLDIDEGGSLILQDSILRLNNKVLRSRGGVKQLGESDIIGDVESIRDQVQGIPTLAGNINIEGSLTTDGVVSLGASPGAGLITGNLTLLPESEMRVEFGGEEPGTEFDFLEVGGTANLDGQLTLSLIDGYVPDNGTEFLFLQAGTIAGAFEEIEQDTLGRERRFAVAAGDQGLTATMEALTIGSYADWRAAFFSASEVADDLISGVMADPDEDGVPNLAEYLSGGLPEWPSLYPLFQVSTNPDQFGIQLANGVGDYTWLIQSSTNLVDWESVAINVLDEDVGEVITLLGIELQDATPSGDRFYRLGIDVASP